MVTATFLSTLFYLFVARRGSCSDSSLGAVVLTDGGGKLVHGVDPSIANDRDERQAPAGLLRCARNDGGRCSLPQRDQQHLSTRAARRMGPCVRRDDLDEER